ncbi:acyltransferase domain-containing protein [Streptomyces sp. H27-D2]|uniref:acyltransferase domain-containing protein n=1 Tax=Streptomyces sp. H27-D2 TaxID=3046304 RepID=UPI002DB9F96F|nr:acyltransferase domain-containing protein [Streptomyces sp. H27-D2]MEC4017579.1 acyltransferase domain-containing protein [Streptomyces sp. H27-D2]
MMDLLRSDESLTSWIKRLGADDDRDIDIALPSLDDLPAVLLDLAVPHEDINELTVLRARVLRDPELWWLLERCARVLVREIGTVDRPFALPVLPAELGAVGRYFYVFVFVAALPYIHAYHRERGVPPHISRHTLADLGRQMAVHRRRRGTGGLLTPGWLTFHFRGELYQLGRLQFERARVGVRTGRAIAASGGPVGPGDPGLGVHIPDFRGPLTPTACARSLALARAFFPRHFPDETYPVAACHSWLLDAQLREYLPADSNIVRFQDCFRPGYEETDPSDTEPIGFVFGDPDLPVEKLPRRTVLERAIADHLLAGRHWYGGDGWLEM